MKRSRFSHTQIAALLKEFEGGETAEQINRGDGVSKASLYKWWQPYGGMQASELKRIKDLEEENARQKRMYDNLPMEFARIAGGQVIARNINDQRLQFCKDKLKVSYVINATSEHVTERLKEISNGDFPTDVIDITGNRNANRIDFEHVIACMKKRWVNPTTYMTHRVLFHQVKDEFAHLLYS